MRPSVNPKGGGGRAATVLLVDDEPAVLSAVRRVLTRAGHNVLATSDSTKALDIMGATEFDVLIADLSMPGMSGAELVSAACERYPQVVRIVLTGGGSVRETEKLINDGEVHRFLTKPFQATELRAVVAQAVARKDELHRSTVAGRSMARRAQLLADLEREHPGISLVCRNGAGVYMLELSRLAALEAKLEHCCLRDLGRLVPQRS
jgi:DNA-binding NtrC family response regulator